MKWISRSVPVLLAVGVVCAGTGSALASPVADTDAGRIAGVQAGAVNEWRGIPYAAPPVGQLRWRPPVPAPPWSGTLDGADFAPPCMQMSSWTTTVGSEDCLYLNVFAPADAAPGSRLPVMVHLHPGGNFFGSPYREGAAWTERGVILVTVAYRLGAFGFIGHPALSAENGGTSGEYALLDQLAALRWVRRNVTAFGGDPERVTLFGSSAGSFDTVALMASPLSEGLIVGAAAQGESFWGLTGKFTTIADTEAIGADMAQAAGCASHADVAACLRSRPAEELVLGIGPGDVSPWVGGEVLPESPLSLVGKRETVPLLVGFNREEDAGFIYEPGPYPRQRWVKDTNVVVGPKYGDRARELYPPSDYDSLQWSRIALETDAVRGCPTRRLAGAVRAPVYRFLYTHAYDDNPELSQYRASHVFEEQLLWHADVFGFGHTLSAAEETLSRRMTNYWANFARSGNPNGSGLPTWPRYETRTEPSLTLDNSIGLVERYHKEQCALIDQLEAPFASPFEVTGHGPSQVPPAFWLGRARAFP